MSAFGDAIDAQGYALVRDIADDAETLALRNAFSTAEIARAERGGQTFGARNILNMPEVKQFMASRALGNRLEEIVGPDAKATRGIFFDKTEAANWPVLWHQDLSLAVKERHDIPGWELWSVKHGVTHVQPPAYILEKMIAVRLHLDDCPPENGALKVIPGSHKQGRLPRNVITQMTSAENNIIAAAKGDALFMRPLLLHASSPAKTPSHRRVLHIEFAPYDLMPPKIAWAEGA